MGQIFATLFFNNYVQNDEIVTLMLDEETNPKRSDRFGLKHYSNTPFNPFSRHKPNERVYQFSGCSGDSPLLFLFFFFLYLLLSKTTAAASPDMSHEQVPTCIFVLRAFKDLDSGVRNARYNFFRFVFRSERDP